MVPGSGVIFGGKFRKYFDLQKHGQTISEKFWILIDLGAWYSCHHNLIEVSSAGRFVQVESKSWEIRHLYLAINFSQGILQIQQLLPLKYFFFFSELRRPHKIYCSQVVIKYIQPNNIMFLYVRKK